MSPHCDGDFVTWPIETQQAVSRLTLDEFGRSWHPPPRRSNRHFRYWIAMFCDGPVIHALVNCTRAGPALMPSGTRMSSRYVSTNLGHPILLITSAGLPLNVTLTGELTSWSGSDGNGSPGSMPGRVGPSPVACRMRTSP